MYEVTVGFLVHLISKDPFKMFVKVQEARNVINVYSVRN